MKKQKILLLVIIAFALILQCGASEPAKSVENGQGNGWDNYYPESDVYGGSNYGEHKDVVQSGDTPQEYYEENEEEFSFNSAAIGKNHILYCGHKQKRPDQGGFRNP